MVEHRDPDLMLVLGYGTIGLTPWFRHATVSQTNARNASSELAAMYLFSAGGLMLRSLAAFFKYFHMPDYAAPHILAVAMKGAYKVKCH